MSLPRLFSFVGGEAGTWRVARMGAFIGETLARVGSVEVRADAPVSPGSGWVLRGIMSNERYVTRPEKTELVAKQEGLGRPAASCAALIPIKKSAEWWGLTQDERRKIFEDQSAHTKTGMQFLPAIARRLHHCRDLGPEEPFDFLTWFEFAPEDTGAFDDLLARLRATPEWAYVTREVDIRLERSTA